MTAVPFSSFEQHKVDAAKQHEKMAARLRKEAEDARKQRQVAEDARASVIAVEAEVRLKERQERLRVNTQRDKFARGMVTLKEHFTERIGLYDAQIESFSLAVLNDQPLIGGADHAEIVIKLRRKP